MTNRFAQMFRQGPVATLLVRRDDGTVIDANDAACRLLGKARHELLGRQSVGVGGWTPEERAALGARVRAGDLAPYHDLRLINGEYVRLSFATLDTDEDGACLLVTLEVITARRRAEHEIRQIDQDSRFRAIFDSTFQFIGLLSPAGILLEANRTSLDFTGVEARDVVGSPFWDTRWWQTTEATRERLREAVRDAAAGAFVRYVVDVRGRGDVVTTIDFSLKPLRDAAGDVVLLVAEGRDIGDVKKVQADLIESEDRFHSACEAAAIGMALVAPEGRVLLANPALCELLGYTRDAFMQLSIADITHPDDFDDDRRQAQRMAAGDIRSYQKEQRFFHRDGHAIWTRLTGSAVRDVTGTLVHYIVQIEDVTAARATQQALERMLMEKDLLLHEVHHRVKNNLQIISSLLSLQRRAVEDPATRDALEDSRRRVQAMALVHQSLYRGDTVASIDMQRYLAELVAHVCDTLAATAAHVTTRMETEPLVVPVDIAIPCGLIVNELLSNVLKYAFVGRAAGEVRVTCLRREDTVELAIDDNGDGFRGGRREGSIGMSLVEGLARQLRGSFSVDSADGVRAVVRFPHSVIEGRS